VRIVCDACEGRGWFTPPSTDAFPVPCEVCAGRGCHELCALAKRFRMDSRTIRRVLEFKKVRVATAQKLLEACTALLDRRVIVVDGKASPSLMLFAS